MLKSDLEACSIEIKELKQRLDHSSSYKVFSPPCEVCGTLKVKLLHGTKENSKLKQEFLTCLHVLREPMWVRKWLRMI
jgi:hypothetical protein